MTNSLIIYLISFLLINLFFILNFNSISKNINLYDIPDGKRKIHKIPTPLIGGSLIFFNSLFFVIFFFIIDKSYIFNSFYLSELKAFIYFFITFTLIFLIGIYDDKYKMSALLRLIILSIIILLYLKTDNTSLLSKINFSFIENEISLNYGSSFFTYLCLIVLIISCNMFDGVNLQSFIFYFSNFLILFIINPNIFILNCCLSLLIFGFFNYKGKIFLGDSGVYLLSLFLGILYIKYYNFNMGNLSGDIVFSFLFFPVLDAGRCVLMRLVNGINPFNADRLHFHHILLNRFSFKISLIILSFFIILPFIIYSLKITSLISILITSTLYLFLFFKCHKK